jgi:hypothetical protein
LFEILKKLTAIFLFTLFLFNVIGYRIVFFYAQQQSDKQLEAKLDRDQYNESELVTIKVPLSLPYQTDQAEFERVDGEITFNGKIYKYVKRKITEGNLILLCLPDYNKMRLKKEKEDFFKDSNNLAQNQGSKKQENSKSSIKNILSEYDPFHYNYVTALFEDNSCHTFSSDGVAICSAPHSSPEQPPELA